MAANRPYRTISTDRCVVLSVSEPVPRGTALMVHEVSTPVGFEEPADTDVTLQKARTLVRIVNRQAAGVEPHYTG